MLDAKELSRLKTYEEMERHAYITGRVALADMYRKLMDNEENEDDEDER